MRKSFKNKKFLSIILCISIILQPLNIRSSTPVAISIVNNIPVLVELLAHLGFGANNALFFNYDRLSKQQNLMFKVFEQQRQMAIQNLNVNNVVPVSNLIGILPSSIVLKNMAQIALDNYYKGIAKEILNKYKQQENSIIKQPIISVIPIIGKLEGTVVTIPQDALKTDTKNIQIPVYSRPKEVSHTPSMKVVTSNSHVDSYQNSTSNIYAEPYQAPSILNTMLDNLKVNVSESKSDRPFIDHNQKATEYYYNHPKEALKYCQSVEVKIIQLLTIFGGDYADKVYHLLNIYNGLNSGPAEEILLKAIEGIINSENSSFRIFSVGNDIQDTIDNYGLTELGNGNLDIGPLYDAVIKIVNNQELQKLAKTLDKEFIFQDLNKILALADKMEVKQLREIAKNNNFKEWGFRSGLPYLFTFNTKFNKEILNFFELANQSLGFDEMLNIIKNYEVNSNKRYVLTQLYKALFKRALKEKGIFQYINDPLWKNLTDKEKIKLINSIFEREAFISILKERDLKKRILMDVFDIKGNSLSINRIYDLLDLSGNVEAQIDLLMEDFKNKNYEKSIIKDFFLSNGILKIYKSHKFAQAFELNKKQPTEIQLEILSLVNKLLSYSGISDDQTSQVVANGLKYIEHANLTTGKDSIIARTFAKEILNGLSGKDCNGILIKEGFLFDHGKTIKIEDVFNQILSREQLTQNSNSAIESKIKHTNAIITKFFNLFNLQHNIEAKIDSLVRELKNNNQIAIKEFFLNNGILKIYESHEFAHVFIPNNQHSSEVQSEILSIANKLLYYTSTNEPKILDAVKNGLKYIEHANKTRGEESVIARIFAKAILKGLPGRSGNNEFYRPLLSHEFLFDGNESNILTARIIAQQIIIREALENLAKKYPENYQIRASDDSIVFLQDSSNQITKNKPSNIPPQNNGPENQGPENELNFADKALVMASTSLVDPTDPAHHQKIETLIESVESLIHRINTHPVLQNLGVRFQSHKDALYHVIHGNLRRGSPTGCHTNLGECCFKIEKVKTLAEEAEAICKITYNGITKPSTKFPDSWTLERQLSTLLNWLDKGTISTPPKIAANNIIAREEYYRNICSGIKDLYINAPCCERSIILRINNGIIDSYYPAADKFKKLIEAGKILCENCIP